MIQETSVGVANIEQLLASAYRPELADPAFVQNVEEHLLFAAHQMAQERNKPMPAAAPQTLSAQNPAALAADAARRARINKRCGLALTMAASIALCAVGWYASVRLAQPTAESPSAMADAKEQELPVHERGFGLLPRPRPSAVQANPLPVGETLATHGTERRRVTLADGSVLYLNQNTAVEQTASRRLKVHHGEIYLEVQPSREKSFLVSTPSGEVTALGTRFAVNVDGEDTGVVVTQGKVQVKRADGDQGLIVEAGQQATAGRSSIAQAPRVSHVLDWTRELMAAACTPLVPGSKHAGGALIAALPNGQEIQLTLRKYVVDVHIEDGFARTTIDQTYFNNENARLEGTFYFPLPPDAALSRLAMYVEDGKECVLMEGGMAERDHARNVYEEIRHARRDPALLEWVDGSTFKMRVFPLEARKEKRVLLSYTQRLPMLYGAQRYRFPAGHNMELVRDWQFQAVIKNGSKYVVTSESHGDQGAGVRPTMEIKPVGEDYIAQAAAKNIKPNQDVTLELYEIPGQMGQLHKKADGGGVRALAHHPRGGLKPALQEQARFTGFESLSGIVHVGEQYLMLRFQPALVKPQPRRERRDWVFLFESGANRDPLLARAQIEIVRTLLENAEHDDTFSILTAGTRVRRFDSKPHTPTARSVEEAIKFLEATHLIGALDLEKALGEAAKLVGGLDNPHLVHVGAGIPALGERREEVLAKSISAKVRYVGIGVGKRWSRAFMKMAAERSSGLFAQINPDEAISWKAFELLATLNTPRLMEIEVSADGMPARFLTETLSLAQGEELCAVVRLPGSSSLPRKVTVSGKIDGAAYAKQIPVENVSWGAGYLPRQWARLEIERLLAEDGARNKQTIIGLSKASYVMSPFTSLLVLETEADYAKYNVDRGRRDHWAMYACPAKTAAPAYEPDPRWNPEPAKKGDKATVKDVMESIRVRVPSKLLKGPGTANPPASVNAWQACGFGEITSPSADDYELFLEGIMEAPRGSRRPGPVTYFKGNGNSETIFVEPFVRDGGKWARPRAGVTLEPLTWSEQKAKSDSIYLESYIGYRGLKPKVDLDALEDGPGLISINYAITQPPGVSKVGQIFVVGNDVTQDRVILRLLSLYPGQTLRYPELELELGQRRSGLTLEPLTWSERQAKLEQPLWRDFGTEINEMLNRVTPFYGTQFPTQTGTTQTQTIRQTFQKFRAEEAQAAAQKEKGDKESYKVGTDLRMFGTWKDGMFLETPNKDFYIHIGGEMQFDNAWFSNPSGNLTPIMRAFSSGGIISTTAELEWRQHQLAVSSKNWSPLPRINSPTESFEYLNELARPVTSAQISGNAIDQRLSLIYHRPVFSNDARIFSDLLQYAPGLNTTDSDIRGVLEAELPAAAAKPGSVDPGVRKLIDTARSLGWKCVTLGDKKNPLKLCFNGAGHYRFERTLPNGLVEQVVCDGATLLHLYPEIGLGARRNVQRFHRADLAELLPWLVLPVDDLARFCDVHLVDEQTVALVPNSALKPDRARTKGGTKTVRLVFARDGRLSQRQLVDGKGRVAYRQIYEEDGSIRHEGNESATFKHDIVACEAPDLAPDTSNLVLLPLPLRSSAHLGAQVKNDEPLSREQALSRIAAYSVEGNGNLAYDLIWSHFYSKGDRRLGFLTLLSAATAVSYGESWYKERWNDRYSGLKKIYSDAAADNPGHPLARYLAHVNNLLAGERDAKADEHKPQPGLVPRLAEFFDQYHYLPQLGLSAAPSAGQFPPPGTILSPDELKALIQAGVKEYLANEKLANEKLPQATPPSLPWPQSPSLTLQTAPGNVPSPPLPPLAPPPGALQPPFPPQAATPPPPPQMPPLDSKEWIAQRDRVLAYVKTCPSAVHAWVIIDQLRSKSLVNDPVVHRAAAEMFERFGAETGLIAVARYERARSLWLAGDHDRARSLFSELYRDAVKAGAVPLIDGDFVQALKEGVAPLVRETSLRFVKEKQVWANLLLARQLWQLGQTDLSNEVFDLAMSSGQDLAKETAALLQRELPESPRKKLFVQEVEKFMRANLLKAGLEHCRQTNQQARAEAILGQLLEIADGHPGLWRLAAELAQKRGNAARQFACLEKAMDLEFQNLPEVVNLQAVRQDYGDLLQQYQQLATSLSILQSAPPKDFLAKVVRTADRWRLLDPDSSTVYQQMAKILQTLGARDLAWDYLTTPIGLKPGESGPWLSLAGTLAGEGELDLADRAYAAAFQAEPTNAQILWDRAQNLNRLGRTEEARTLERQIAEGSWQPRFQGLRDEARRRLNTSRNADQ